MRRKAKEVTMHRAHLRRPPPEDGAICFSLSLSLSRVCVYSLFRVRIISRRKSRKEPSQKIIIIIFLFYMLSHVRIVLHSLFVLHVCFVIYVSPQNASLFTPWTCTN